MIAGSLGLRASKSSDDAGQTAGDVLGLGGLARDLDQRVAGVDLLAVLHHQVRAGRQQVPLSARPSSPLDQDRRRALLVRPRPRR